MTTDPFWKNVEDFLFTAQEIQDVDTLIFNTQTYFPNEQYQAADADAFFPGSGGNTQLWEALENAGWRIRYIDGRYHWLGQPPQGEGVLEYVEGDLYLG